MYLFVIWFLATATLHNLPNIYLSSRKGSDSAHKKKKNQSFFAWADKHKTQ